MQRVQSATYGALGVSDEDELAAFLADAPDVGPTSPSMVVAALDRAALARHAQVIPPALLRGLADQYRAIADEFDRVAIEREGH